jgi:hypothetical protein
MGGLGHDKRIQSGFRHNSFHCLLRRSYVGRLARQGMEGLILTASAIPGVGGERHHEAHMKNVLGFGSASRGSNGDTDSV